MTDAGVKERRQGQRCDWHYKIMDNNLSSDCFGPRPRSEKPAMSFSYPASAKLILSFLAPSGQIKALSDKEILSALRR